MTITGKSSLRDVATAVGGVLAQHRIRAVLTGGACAALYARGQYTSRDLDFILQDRVSQSDLDAALIQAGFRRAGDRYTHPRSPFWVEFPRGPLAIGADYRIRPVARRVRGGQLMLLSATDTVRDRLAAFYHWDDRQSLEVALLVATRHQLDLRVIREWSRDEGHQEKLSEFLAERAKRRRSRRRRSASPRRARA